MRYDATNVTRLARKEFSADHTMTPKRSDTGFFPTTRLTLLARLGDPASRAWDEFFAIYGPVIYRMARADGLNDHDADEVVAVVMRYFFGAVAAGFQFDPHRGQFRRYLRRATNIIIRRVRNGHHAGRGRGGAPTGQVRASERPIVLAEFDIDDLPDAPARPDDEWHRVERQERWQVCLERLEDSTSVSPRDMEAFRAYVLHGEPARRVAKRLGIRPNRLYGIKHEMTQRLRKLREELDTELGEV